MSKERTYDATTDSQKGKRDLRLALRLKDRRAGRLTLLSEENLRRWIDDSCSRTALTGPGAWVSTDGAEPVWNGLESLEKANKWPMVVIQAVRSYKPKND